MGILYHVQYSHVYHILTIYDTWELTLLLTMYDIGELYYIWYWGIDYFIDYIWFMGIDYFIDYIGGGWMIHHFSNI